MNRVILIILASVIVFSYNNVCKAQIEIWNRIYGGDNVDNFYSIVETPDSGFIVAGNTKSFGGVGVYSAFLVRINSAGDTIWTRAYSDSINAITLYSISEMNDGNYIIGGGYQTLYFAKIDIDGNFIWDRDYGSLYGQIRYIKEIPEGGFIALGYDSFYDNISILARLDGTGFFIWSNYIDGQPGGFVFDDNGDIVFTIMVDNAGESSSLYLSKYSIESDSLGSYEILHDDSTSYKPADIQRTNDDGYIIVGDKYPYPSGSHCWFALRINSFYEVDWLITYAESSLGNANSVIALEDGSFIVGGTENNYDTNRRYMGTLLKVDSLGNAIWARQYGGDRADKLFDALLTSDSCIIFAGSSSTYSGGMPDAWVVKVTNSDITSVDNDIDVPDGFSRFGNYPNPFNSQTKISYFVDKPGDVEISIYNLLGQKVYSNSQYYNSPGEYFLIWDAGSLSSGIYFARFSTDEFIASKRMLLLK